MGRGYRDFGSPPPAFRRGFQSEMIKSGFVKEIERSEVRGHGERWRGRTPRLGADSTQPRT
jgi:hypothetical protein